jgi:hypothetical protein
VNAWKKVIFRKRKCFLQIFLILKIFYRNWNV